MSALEVPDGVVHIGGRFTESLDGGTLDVVDPFTEQTLATVPDAGPRTGAAAVRAARDAFDGWSSTPPSERAALLRALSEVLEEHGETMAQLATREIGMPISQSRVVQVSLPVQVLRSTADIARDLDWDARDASGTSIVREGAGVVLGVTPWNFPVHQIVAKLAPALAAGCTLVLKPAEQTPLNALLLAEMCREAGIPDGVVNVVTGTGATTGESLLQDGGYDVVSFTGSLAVGRHVGAVAGGRVVRATLELGGKSPAVVLEDADLEAAVRTTVRNCFTNAGQKCNAPTRLLVPDARREEAALIALDAAGAYLLGDPADEETTMGPLVSRTQLERVTAYVEGAREDGRVLVPDLPLPPSGFFVRPTVVVGAPDDARVAREEVFGPVLTVLGHDGEDDAVRRANDSEYGLSAEVWSADPARAAGVARRIRAGQVRVNGVRTPPLPIAPFGGYKSSGLGREMGPLAIHEFLEVKAILGDPETA